MTIPLEATVPATRPAKTHGGARGSLRKRWLDVEKNKDCKKGDVEIFNASHRKAATTHPSDLLATYFILKNSNADNYKLSV